MANPHKRSPRPTKKVSSPTNDVKKTETPTKEADNAQKARRQDKPEERAEPSTKGSVLQFLDLPVELRWQVYRLLLPHNTLISIRQSEVHLWQPQCQILSVCKSIYDEAAPLFHGENTFLVDGPPKPGETTYPFISKLNAAHVQKLMLVRWDGRSVAPLVHFAGLKRLVFGFRRTRELRGGHVLSLPPACPVGYAVVRLGEVHMEGRWELPSPPEAVLARCRDGEVAIELAVAAVVFCRYCGELVEGRVDRFEIVPTDRKVGRTRNQYLRSGNLGVAFDLVARGSRRIYDAEDVPWRVEP